MGGVEKKYWRMIRGMKKNGLAEWTVYMLRCGDGSLYTGICKDVESRIKVHNAGKGAAYTRTHLPVVLIYSEKELTRSEALIREAGIKRLRKSKKEALLFLRKANAVR